MSYPILEFDCMTVKPFESLKREENFLYRKEDLNIEKTDKAVDHHRTKLLVYKNLYSSFCFLLEEKLLC